MTTPADRIVGESALHDVAAPHSGSEENATEPRLLDQVASTLQALGLDGRMEERGERAVFVDLPLARLTAHGQPFPSRLGFERRADAALVVFAIASSARHTIRHLLTLERMAYKDDQVSRISLHPDAHRIVPMEFVSPVRADSLVVATRRILYTARLLEEIVSKGPPETSSDMSS